MDAKDIINTLVELLEEQEQIKIQYSLQEVKNDKGGDLNGKTL